MLRDGAVCEVSTQVPICVIRQIDGSLGILIGCVSLPGHDQLIGLIDQVPARHLDRAWELLLKIRARSGKLDAAEASRILDLRRHACKIGQSFAFHDFCVPLSSIEAIGAAMKACIAIVRLKAILGLTDRELGAADPPRNSPAGRAILRILLWLGQVGEALSVERDLLHLVRLALELARKHRRSICDQLDN